MLRSMYSGISGLKNFQTKLDVIGNNIANVNTFGFKKGRVVFKDMMSQTTAGASGPTATRGGVNPKQVGLGAQIAAIDTIHTGGNPQTTNRVLDLAIAGDGFFMLGLKGAPVPPSTDDIPGDFNNIQYTRAGNFYWDEEGYLTNIDGYYLYGYSSDHLDEAKVPNPDLVTVVNKDATPPTLGYKANAADPTVTPLGDPRPIKIPTDAKDMSIGKDGTVTYVDKDGKLKWAGQLIMAKFPNDGGLEKSGNNFFAESSNSGEPIFNFAGSSGIGTTESGQLEMSNVDLSEEFTEMIVAQRAFQANTRIITTSDEILQELVNLKR